MAMARQRWQSRRRFEPAFLWVTGKGGWRCRWQGGDGNTDWADLLIKAGAALDFKDDNGDGKAAMAKQAQI